MPRPKKTSPDACIAAPRRAEAMRLRVLGATYAQIGDRLGISKQAAHEYVSTELANLRAQTAEAAEQVRDLELARLDAVLVPQLKAAIEGSQGAVDRVLRIQERRAKLLGLDAAEKHESKVQIEGFELDLRRAK